MGLSRRRFVGAGVALGAAALLRADRAAPADAAPDPRDAFDAAVQRFAYVDESPTYDTSFAVRAPTSVGVRDVIGVQVRSALPVRLAVLRVGYSATTGRPAGSTVAETLTGAVGEHPDADATTWPISWTLPVAATWASGLYLVVATRVDGAARFAPFVVRAHDPAPVMVQVPITTYQAYNAWGGASLYRYNSPGGVGRHVSLHRPFDVFDGAGFAFYGDIQLAAWLDREGINASWLTSLDLHGEEALDGGRVVVSAFHDEYWSTPMRDRLERFVARGGNAAFFAANSVYWKVRIEGGDMVCHKAVDADDDPHPDPTCTWRNQLVDRSEHLLMGSRYLDYEHPYGTGFPFVVAAADHWVYEGTGVSDGDRMEGLVGYEWDHAPDPTMPGLTVLADSRFTSSDGQAQQHNATLLQHPQGGAVLNVGTTYWPRVLLGDVAFAPDERVGRMTRNVLTRFGA